MRTSVGHPASGEQVVSTAPETARYDRERAAHNKIFSEHTRDSALKFYCIVNQSRALYEGTLLNRCAGSTTLEYGCGQGTHSSVLAQRGAARVVGIDISDVAIAQAREEAERRGLRQMEHYRMNAESLEFQADSFDLICGTAILHHLDLTRAFSELARTLRPGGTAVFMEPLGHNPAINLYRWMTPNLRTVDEHPLFMKDIAMARRYFRKVDVQFFTLQTMLAVPFHGSKWFRPLLYSLEAADRMLFRALPFMKRYAWQVVLILEDPIKAA